MTSFDSKLVKVLLWIITTFTGLTVTLIAFFLADTRSVMLEQVRQKGKNEIYEGDIKALKAADSVLFHKLESQKKEIDSQGIIIEAFINPLSHGKTDQR